MLLGKEIKKTVWSITFFVFMIALAAFQAAQGGLDFSDEILAEPGQGEDYGIQQKEVPELIMPAAFRSLWKEFEANEYTAYPIGFYKNVKLGDADREKMAGIISALTGIPAEELSGGGASLSDDISYEEFRAYMRQADDLIGGGSNYSEDGLLEFSYAAMNYEDAVESYQLIAGKDKFTGAYARLFCDYAGIILSILPVFPAVSMCLKDRRAKMNDLIYVRRTPSCRLVLSRYFAIILAVMLPAAALAYLSNMTVWGKYGNMELDYLAPLKYAVGWLLPSVMIAAAVGLFFTELTGTPVAIAIQGLWWLTDLNAGARRLRGAHTLFELMPRHNSLGNTRGYLDEFQVLAANRLLVAAAALLLVAATLLVYEQKRKGKFGDEGKIKRFLTGLANCKSKFQA